MDAGAVAAGTAGTPGESVGIALADNGTPASTADAAAIPKATALATTTNSEQPPAQRQAVLLQPTGHVVLRDLEGGQKVFRLGSGTKDLRIGKYHPIPIEAILRVPFGATLRYDEKGLWSRCAPCNLASSGAADVEVTENNQHLAQDGSAQALTPSDLKDLKSRCSGAEVVGALTANSATFATKTRFSQEKYIKKKQLRHLQQVTVLRPTVMELCETYMKQSRGKICGLRFDYLSAVLCQADVHSGGRFLLLDCASGLVAAAMAQRLSGLGRIFRVFRGGCSDRAITELDLGEGRKVVRDIPIDVLRSSDPSSQEWLRLPADLTKMGKDDTDEDARVRREARTERVRQRQMDLDDLESQPLDGLVIVSGEDDMELAAETMQVGPPRLGIGGRLAVYGQHLQPLATRQGEMRASGDYVDVRLIQLFTREYQVLPMRTHPHMSADAQLCEGFLLTAIKVADNGDGPVGSNEPTASNESGAGASKRRRKT